MNPDQRRLQQLVLDRLNTKPKTIRLTNDDRRGTDHGDLLRLEELAWKKYKCLLIFDSSSVGTVWWNLKDAKSVDSYKWENFLLDVEGMIVRVQQIGKSETIDLKDGTSHDLFYLLRKIQESLPAGLTISNRGVISRK